MLRRPPRSTRTDTLFPHTPRLRSRRVRVHRVRPAVVQPSGAWLRRALRNPGVDRALSEPAPIDWRSRVEQGAASVRARIEATGAGLDRVQILAVTKGQPVEAVVAAARCGFADAGESYAQELVGKADAIDEGDRQSTRLNSSH